MGRGSRPYETNVFKRRTDYTKSGTGVGGGSSAEKEKDSCLFSFILKTSIDKADKRFKSGDSVALVPGKAEIIEIFVKNIRIANYEGDYKERLLECMSSNHIYTGKIDEITATDDNRELIAMIHGQGR